MTGEGPCRRRQWGTLSQARPRPQSWTEPGVIWGQHGGRGVKGSATRRGVSVQGLHSLSGILDWVQRRVEAITGF